MNLDEFRQSLDLNEPPPNLSSYLLALWHDGKGDWERSHQIIQDVNDRAAAWIHAYLHRKEGDIGNADYWYRRAGRPRPSDSLPEEWEHIVKTLL